MKKEELETQITELEKDIKPNFYLLKFFISNLILNQFFIIVVGLLMAVLVLLSSTEKSNYLIVFISFILTTELIVLFISFDFNIFSKYFFGIQDYVISRELLNKYKNMLNNLSEVGVYQPTDTLDTSNTPTNINLSEDRLSLIELYENQLQGEYKYMSIIFNEAIRKLKETDIKREAIEDWVVESEKLWRKLLK